MNYTKSPENSKVSSRFAIRFIGLLALFAAFALGAAPFVSAQMSDQPTSAELDQFRSDLARVTEELYVNVAELKRSPILRSSLAQIKEGVPEMTTEARAAAQSQLQKMSYEDLAVVYRAFKTHFPKWRESPQIIANLTSKINKNTKGVHKAGGDTTSNAITPDNCQDAFNAEPSWTDWGVTEAIAIAAQGAYEIIPPPLNALAMVAWIPLAEGAHASAILNSIYDRCSGDQAMDTLQTSVTNLQTSVNNVQSAQTSVVNAVDASTTTLSSAITAAKTEIVNNDNANRASIINNATTNTTSLNTAITDARTAILNNTTSNTTSLTTSITDARTAIVNNDNSNATAINTNVTNTRNAIITNDNTNTTNIVNNDNSNRTQIINNANANTTTLNTAITNARTEILNNMNANQIQSSNLLLRTQIEAALGSKDDDISALALYATPASVCFPALNAQGQPQPGNTQCGLLDLTRAIVQQTINNISTPYRDLALREFNMGETLRAAGYYKKAYVNYRKAYNMAAVVESITPR